MSIFIEQKQKNLTVDEMMEQCLKWYPTAEWLITNMFMPDADNNRVPYHFALFGKKTWYGEKEKWEPGYIDKSGQMFFESSLSSSSGELSEKTYNFLTNDCFECAYFEYESSVESVVKHIYEGIAERQK